MTSDLPDNLEQPGAGGLALIERDEAARVREAMQGPKQSHSALHRSCDQGLCHPELVWLEADSCLLIREAHPHIEKAALRTQRIHQL